MKKALLLAVVSASLLVVSCGTARKAHDSYEKQDTSTLGERKAKSPAQLFAEDNTAENLRAWGRYNGFADQNLESYAAAIARAQLADRISVLISNAVSIYDGSKKIANKEVEGGAETIQTAEFSAENAISSVSKELIKGSRVAVSDRYIKKDGTEDCYVAVELNIESIIKAVQESKKLQEAISFDRKTEIDYNSEKFRNSMKDAFNELKQAKQE